MMEALLRKELPTTALRCLGRSGGGCISDGQSYEVDSGRVFVKYNADEKVGVVSNLHDNHHSFVCTG